MPSKISEIQDSIARALNALPGVFSTVQWGGRAYKLPGPNGNRKKPRLLAHTWLSEDSQSGGGGGGGGGGGHVGLSFKLEKKRAAEVVDQFDWIAPHSFRTLAPSGWITAEVRTKSQCKIIARLLRECRAQFPIAQEPAPVSMRRGKPAADAVARRIDAVLRQKREDGWSPAAADSFDD